MYKDERDIYFYDAITRVWNRKYKGLASFPHYELAKAIKELFDADRAEYIQKNTLQSTYITDMRLHQDRCEMLIGFADTVAADPTLNDRPARKRRFVKKAGGEGLEHSAHIIWHYENKANNSACNFYLEGAVGLRSTTIVRFLNRLLRAYSDVSKKFYVPDPEGTVDAAGNYTTIKTRPKIDLMGHPSQEFLKDLKRGELSELELYTETQRNKIWDSNGYAIEDRRSVMIKPNSKKQKLIPKAKSLLDGVLTKTVKRDYEYARVSFKTETNVPRSVRIFSSNYNLINDDTYVKKERVKALGGNLPNAFDSFYGPILNRMRGLAGI
ncbi:hypothetical protein [Lysobacter sp. D1-1-M9]|uniref:hypothetical protein n=1 Tax=Novilysobacter longmucuonensis TaxID=3098603 RepID=UPI002FC911F0